MSDTPQATSPEVARSTVPSRTGALGMQPTSRRTGGTMTVAEVLQLVTYAQALVGTLRDPYQMPADQRAVLDRLGNVLERVRRTLVAMDLALAVDDEGPGPSRTP
jgi:hypothetical protein